jgi:PAS domain S-box-containing protein
MKDSQLNQVSILYVEDDESIRTELVELFEGQFLELYIATNGKEGLEKYEEFHPDIVLTDIRIPEMDGLSMVEKIMEYDSHTHIIISSAFNDSDYLMKAIQMGINYYLLKPINLSELYSTIEKVATEILEKRKLQESEQILSQYKEIVDKSSIVSKADKNGLITFVNDAFVEISGYDRDELIGKNHNIVRHVDMPSSFFKDLWQTLSSKKVWKGIIKNRAKDGSVYYVDSVITPVLDIDGETIEFISLRKDITSIELERQNLEKNLQSSTKTIEEKVAFINEFEKAIKGNALFCRTTKEGVFTMTSQAFDNLFSYEDGELEGTEYLKLISSDMRKNLKNEITSSIEKGDPWQQLIEHKTKNGESIYLESSFIPIASVEDKVSEVLCFFIDLTQNVKLNREILATQREVISTMGAIGETRSKETGAHVKRVAEYSRLLALKVGLTLEEAEELRMASPMHDIGKVGIPDSILNKPGKLTDEEFEVMKTHASLGYNMLCHSDQKLLHTAAIVANEHHEKWDGSGYPNGSSRTNIHIYGRITAITDVFDALGHDRIYKEAWPLEEILDLFKRERGKHFDPQLVDLFMENLDEFLMIKQRFDEVNTEE